MADFLHASLAGTVGGRTATALEKAFGMRTVEDLLRHYPRRYAERGELTDLASLEVGASVTVLAQVVEATSRPMRQRKGNILDVKVTDGKSRISLAFFNAAAWQAKAFRPGRHGLFAGTVTSFRGQLSLQHPEYELLPDGVDDDPELITAFASPLIPIYPATRAMSSWRIQRTIGLLLDQVTLAAQSGDLLDPLPESVRRARGLVDIAQAFLGIHRPASGEELGEARRRLTFEEAFVLQALLVRRRQEQQTLTATRRAPSATPLLNAFDARLPFELTAGQREVGAQIAEDMAREHPMHRLLQGDVGSGKTVVALRAMLHAVDAGGQAALLAPTEVLATQHFRSISTMLGSLGERGRLGGAAEGTSVALVTGSQKAGARRAHLLDVVSGDAGIVVGTHALLEDVVDFYDLALVVVDEQHRFGVEQRAALAAKARDGARPHVLVMTATPIPRTVAMTVFGDVDVSTLAELPAGRAPITTHVVAMLEQPTHVKRAWERVREEVARGHRVFVVCPRIGDDSVPDAPDESASSDDLAIALAGAVPLAQELQADQLSGLRVEVLHGRLPADVKDDVMRRFADPGHADGVDVLVSTTVVEVGVDVPQATMMIVMDADRFGISQLHQLRGRVGRGGLPGLCLLMTAAPAGSPARERLAAVASTTDGFELAALDLELRREGDVLGSVQSGRRSSLRLLEVTRDGDIIEEAREDAVSIIGADPALQSHPVLAATMAAWVEQDQADYLERA